jgi:hypothetical protein
VICWNLEESSQGASLFHNDLIGEFQSPVLAALRGVEKRSVAATTLRFEFAAHAALRPDVE